MSTLTLQSITSYVGSDSSGSKAYGYTLSYQDSGVTEDVEPISGQLEEIAGEHLLTRITPSVYQIILKGLTRPKTEIRGK